MTTWTSDYILRRLDRHWSLSPRNAETETITQQRRQLQSPFDNADDSTVPRRRRRWRRPLADDSDDDEDKGEQHFLTSRLTDASPAPHLCTQRRQDQRHRHWTGYWTINWIIATSLEHNNIFVSMFYFKSFCDLEFILPHFWITHFWITPYAQFISPSR